MNNEEVNVVGRLVASLRGEGYQFLHTDGTIGAAHVESHGNLAAQAAVAVAASISFGLLGALSSGADSISDEELRADLGDVASLGLLAGYAQVFGGAQLALLIDCTRISDETLVGKLSLLLDKGKRFQKYSLALMKSRLGDSRLPVSIMPYLIFTEASGADHFMNAVWSKCPKRKFWAGVTMFPWVLDIPNRRYFMYRPLRGFLEQSVKAIFG